MIKSFSNMEERHMVDLSVDFARVKFKNPIVMASMVFGWSGEALKKAGLAGASGVVCKSIGSPAETFEHPRCGRMVLYRHNGIPIGMQNNEIFSTTNVDEWIDRELKIAAEGGARMVVSIVANPKASDTADLARKVARTGLVDIFELNVSCPMPAAGVGMNIGKVPELSAEQVRAVKNACPDIPLMPKMTPNVSDIAAVAKACEEAGADAIAATNSVQALVGVDVETGIPLLPAFGGYSGPVVHHAEVCCPDCSGRQDPDFRNRRGLYLEASRGDDDGRSHDGSGGYSDYLERISDCFRDRQGN
jgi:dihydropyrimidine dehydrogenase (NAD+) subunit PreA